MKSHQDSRRKQIARGLFRIMLSGIFIVAGINHLRQTKQTAARLESAPMGHLATYIADPHTLVLLASVPLIIAGIALLIGLFTPVAAMVLIAMIIPITLTVQIGDLSTMGPLFKNIGLTGGLLYFAAHGSHSVSVDGLRQADES